MAESTNNKPLIQPDTELLRQLVQTLSNAVAIVDSETWSVQFENASFFKWFPPSSDADEPLVTRLTGFNADRALARLKEGRVFSFETEGLAGTRNIPVGVELRQLPDNSSNQIVVECRDLSKKKQAEYMLESYSQMAEKNSRDLQREKDRVERLLLNIMPKSVYEEMRDYGTVTPQLFHNASILMLDFVGHTEMAISGDPAALITELNDIFNVFDRITDLFDCVNISAQLEMPIWPSRGYLSLPQNMRTMLPGLPYGCCDTLSGVTQPITMPGTAGLASIPGLSSVR